MKNIISKIKNIKLSAKMYWLLAAAAVLLRLLMVSCQSMTLYPETSMLDDMLMLKASESILEGRWLGSYSYLAMGKHMLFALWLAGITKLGVSYLLAGQLLYCAAALLLVQSAAPAVKNRLLRLLGLAYLLFSPTSYADFTLRVYRDNITVAFAMLVFAAFIAIALRLTDERPGVLLCWGALGGFALGCSYLLREDGWWLFPFCGAAVAVCAVVLVIKKPKKVLLRGCSFILIAAVASGLILGYCGMNYRHYGRFAVSDLTSAEFQAAYGAMTRVVADPEDYNPIVPIPRSSRDKLYAASPLFAELEQYLESAEFSRWQKDCGGIKEYSGGGFYWAVRNAASLAGYYETPATAKAYFEALAAEINAACDSGAFEALPARTGLNSPITSERILPTLEEAVRSLITVTTYGKLSCSPELSTGPEQKLQALADYTNCSYQNTEKILNPDTRVIFWAYSEQGNVNISIVDGDKEVPLDTKRGTGSDIYLDELFAGYDRRYTDYCRYYACFAGSATDTMALNISSGSSSVVLPLTSMNQPAVEGDIHYRVEWVGQDYTEQPVHGFIELWLYRLMRVVVLCYRIVNPVLFVLSVFLFARGFLLTVRKKAFREGMGLGFIIAFGVLMMSALRIGMVSFAEVSAFGIGTYPMYLAAVYPLLILFCLMSLALHGRAAEK